MDEYTQCLFEFEYSGFKMKFCQRHEPGTWVCDLGILHTCEGGKTFLDDDRYYHRAFVFGRSIFIQRKGEHV